MWQRSSEELVEVSRVMQESWNSFSISWKFLAVRVFLERGPQTDEVVCLGLCL